MGMDELVQRGFAATKGENGRIENENNVEKRRRSNERHKEKIVVLHYATPALRPHIALCHHLNSFARTVFYGIFGGK